MAFCDGIKTSRDFGPVIQTCGYSLNQLQGTESKKRVRNAILWVFRPGSSLDLKAGEGQIPFNCSKHPEDGRLC